LWARERAAVLCHLQAAPWAAARAAALEESSHPRAVSREGLLQVELPAASHHQPERVVGQTELAEELFHPRGLLRVALPGESSRRLAQWSEASRAAWNHLPGAWWPGLSQGAWPAERFPRPA
jgi:hypothetical protein